MAQVPLRDQHKRSDDFTQDVKVTASQKWITFGFSTVVVLVGTTLEWPRYWILSGCALENLLLIYASEDGSRIFPFIPLWTLLATLNLIYAICSTSWLLYACFTILCIPSIGLTCLCQSHWVADWARRWLRKTLKQLHLIKDKVAFFNLPALEIDVDVDGLMVIRGVTFSLSTLTMVAHGIELGIKLADDIELAMFCDQVTVQFFRRIEVGDVYGNVKGGKSEMTFAELDDDAEDQGASDDESIFQGHTALLRAATAGSEGFHDRPKLRESLTGGSFVRDSSAKAGFNAVTRLSPDDAKAEEQYNEITTEIRTSSPIYQSRARVRESSRKGVGFSIDSADGLRAAICAELHELPSVPHPPERSVRVTTLKNLPPPYVRRFMHRLPFLLRLLLAPLSFFHPVKILSVNVAGSGHWVSSLLQQKVFKAYSTENSGLRKLERRIRSWLGDCSFCVQLTDIDGQGQVPLSTNFDILASLRTKEIIAYRTAPETTTMSQVVRLGGADAAFTIPSYLLPHHEHILPALPSKEEEEETSAAVERADGVPKIVQAQAELERVRKDETTMGLSVHGSLPATFDQSLLNFVAALVKATKMIELEKDVDDPEQTANEIEESMRSPGDFNYDSDGISRPGSPTKSLLGSPTKSTSSPSAKDARIKGLARNFKDFAKDLHQSTRDGMKKALVGGIVNDRWIAKMVGKIASKLEKAQGNIGYAIELPIPLAPYRPTEKLPSKLLP